MSHFLYVLHQTAVHFCVVQTASVYHHSGRIHPGFLLSISCPLSTNGKSTRSTLGQHFPLLVTKLPHFPSLPSSVAQHWVLSGRKRKVAFSSVRISGSPEWNDIRGPHKGAFPWCPAWSRCLSRLGPLTVGPYLGAYTALSVVCLIRTLIQNWLARCKDVFSFVFPFFPNFFLLPLLCSQPCALTWKWHEDQMSGICSPSGIWGLRVMQCNLCVPCSRGRLKRGNLGTICWEGRVPH